MTIRGLLPALLLLLPAAPAAAQVPGLDIDLRAGINTTSFSETPAEYGGRSSHTNWFVGGDLRFGGPFFVQPGFYYQKQGFGLKDGPGGDQDVGISSFLIPVEVGFNLAIPGFGVELGAGPTLAINTSASDVRKDDLNGTRFGGMASVKAKVLVITGFIAYQFDFTDTFKDSAPIRTDGQMSQWMFGLGVNF